MKIDCETGQLFIISRSGSGQVLKFNLSFGILSKRPDLQHWIPLQNLREFTCTSYKNHVYIFGGYNINSGKALRTVKRYDVYSKEWIDLPNMDLERRMCSAVIFKDEILVCGGFKNIDKLHTSSEIFSISKGKWRKGPSFKKGISDIQLVVFKNSVFGFGGMKNSYYKDKIIFCSNDEILEYKDYYKEWLLLDEDIPFLMSKPVHSHSIVEIESKIYIIGGLKTIVDFDGNLNDIINTRVESLNLDINQERCLINNVRDWISPWNRSLPSPNISRYGAATIALGSDIYLFGGTASNQTNGVLEVERFNTKCCRWNIEFIIKHNIDMSMICAVRVYGSRPNENIIISAKDVQNEEPVNTHQISAKTKKMYKVGWVLW